MVSNYLYEVVPSIVPNDQFGTIVFGQLIIYLTSLVKCNTRNLSKMIVVTKSLTFKLT